MGSSVVDLGPGLVAALLVLTALAAAAGWGSGPGQQRPVVTAALRAAGQPAAVSAVLVAVVGSLQLSALFVLVMLSVVLVGLLAAQCLAVWVTLELVARGRLGG